MINMYENSTKKLSFVQKLKKKNMLTPEPPYTIPVLI